MNFRFHVSYLALALALATSFMKPAMADESNKETRMQISAPLQIPGHVLEPGRYIFRLADSPSNRNIVQVFSEDANGNETFITTILAVSAYRLKTPEKPMFDMEERPAGTPEAIRTWYYPGENTGWEFVYSKPYPVAQTQVAAAQTAPAPVEAPAPAAEPEAAPAPEPTPVEEAVVTETTVAEADTAVVAPEGAPEADRVLPETAGYSVVELLAGMTMLSLGGLILFVARRRNEA